MLQTAKIVATLFVVAWPIYSYAKIPRSAAVKREFQRENPCPSTGKPRGKCPGFQVDHVIPLKCDGPDTPANMQWLTIQDHKAKTRREARWCRRH